MSPGRPKRRAREAKVRAELGLPPKPPGARALNATELALLKDRHERYRNERVEKLTKRGRLWRAAWASLPPISAQPWAIPAGFLAYLGILALSFWIMHVLKVDFLLTGLFTVAIGWTTLAIGSRVGKQTFRLSDQFDDDED